MKEMPDEAKGSFLFPYPTCGLSLVHSGIQDRSTFGLASAEASHLRNLHSSSACSSNVGYDYWYYLVTYFTGLVQKCTEDVMSYLNRSVTYCRFIYSTQSDMLSITTCKKKNIVCEF